MNKSSSVYMRMQVDIFYAALIVLVLLTNAGIIGYQRAVAERLGRKNQTLKSTRSVEDTSTRLDESIEACIITLTKAEKLCTRLTARIEDAALKPFVRETLRIQRTIVCEEAQSRIAHLKNLLSGLDKEIRVCQALIEQNQHRLDETSASRCFEVLKRERAKLAEQKARTEAIAKAWHGFILGRPLAF